MVPLGIEYGRRIIIWQMKSRRDEIIYQTNENKKTAFISERGF